MSKGEGAAPGALDAALPTDTFFGDRDEVFFNGEAIQIIHQPAAHTDGDVMVFFRKSDSEWVRCDYTGHRSRVPPRALRNQLAVPAGVRCVEVESEAMQGGIGSKSNENMFAAVTQQRSDYSDGG